MQPLIVNERLHKFILNILALETDVTNNCTLVSHVEVKNWDIMTWTIINNNYFCMYIYCLLSCIKT